MTTPTLLRLEEHAALARLTLSGKVLDLGGEKKSGYLRMMKGEYVVTTVNLDARANPDVVHDLEQPLPFADASYDYVLLINVLEHVYDYRQLIAEAARVVKVGGSIVIVVPFLFPVHPSPKDYWRFSADALTKECAAIPLRTQSLTPLGRGVFSARYLLIDRLMPGFIRWLSFYSLRYVTLFLDMLFAIIARWTRRKYNPSDYPLGYLLVASK